MTKQTCSDCGETMRSGEECMCWVDAPAVPEIQVEVREEPAIYTIEPHCACFARHVVFGKEQTVFAFSETLQHQSDCVVQDCSIGRRGQPEDVQLNLES